MSLSELDGKTLVLAAACSLVGYVFYGHINLEAKVETIDTKQTQVIGEQKDLWSKYNAEALYKIEFMKEYYEGRLEDEQRWTDYWKEKAEDK
jgi:hypothetical protein